MNRTTWLHLSDVHYEHQNFDTEYMREELIKKISTFSKDIKISFIVITGDLSCQSGDGSLSIRGRFLD